MERCFLLPMSTRTPSTERARGDRLVRRATGAVALVAAGSTALIVGWLGHVHRTSAAAVTTTAARTVAQETVAKKSAATKASTTTAKTAKRSTRTTSSASVSTAPSTSQPVATSGGS